MELGPHLRRIGNDIVALYLVHTPEGVTLIDAGLPGHWAELLAELRLIGRSIDDVRGVILTHGDSDHLGFAERIRRDHGVPVFVHPADADRAKGGPKPANAKQTMKLGPVLGFAAYSPARAASGRIRSPRSSR
ncbi:MBL fold metallo-hydrolase [Rathayibacter oskolensis]|uniref:MBL fold metallo-hydrolase n=1 Tax=Rathayibacter oskolensis TaxID=1891671 RepID=UPI00265E3DFC|nr:MBL fold metallo-hydrolase [Rathayibacter oskolensis]WKK72428.1 MBL fold metallo-hydrolase [Rathayibacter oskolensis]